MKILYVINNLTKGGAERFVLDLVTFLKKDTNIDFHIAVLDGVNDYEEYDLSSMSITNIDYSPFSFRKKNNNIKFSTLLDDFQPDIVHSNLFLAEFLTAQDTRTNIQYVCHGHDNMHQFQPLRFSDFLNKKKILNRLDYYILSLKKYHKTNTYFIANSIHTLKFYKKSVPEELKKNVHLIQCGFNFKKYFHEKEQFLNRKLKLVNVGSYQTKKNQQFLVDVAEVLRNKGVDFEINLIGSGTEFEAVKRKIDEKELTHYVFQRGLQSNVQQWYQDSDFYVHAATYEPFGLVFLEAMAAGLPIVTLDGRGNRDIIENDKNGYLLDEIDAELFAAKIIEFSTDKVKYQSLSNYAQEYAKQFDVSIKNKELVAFYESILK